MSRQRLVMGICPLCNRSNGELMYLDDVEGIFALHMRSTTPCNACKKRHLSKGVLLVTSGTYRTLILKEESFVRVFNSNIPRSRTIVISEGEMDDLTAMIRDDIAQKMNEART